MSNDSFMVLARTPGGQTYIVVFRGNQIDDAIYAVSCWQCDPAIDLTIWDVLDIQSQIVQIALTLKNERAEKMASENQTIELKNVGPIQHLSVPILANGGLVVLRGSNGTGKTHALNAVQALYDKTTRKDLRQTDGTQSGTVEGMGVTLRLGRSNTARGDLTFEVLEGRVDPSVLVDPGIKDPHAADSKRLATLIRLAGIKVTLAEWQKLMAGVTGDIIWQDLVDADPVVTADRLRRQLHAVALAREQKATEKAGEAATLTASIADVDLTQPHDQAALATELSDAIKALSDAENKVKTADALMLHADECAKLLDSEKPIDLVAVVATAKSHADFFDATVAKISQLEKELALMVAQRNELSRLIADANAEHERGVKQQARFTEWRGVIDKAKAAERPSDDDIAQLATAKTMAMARAQNAEVIRRAIDTKGRAESTQTIAAANNKDAKRFRDLARSTDQVLENALVTAGYGNIKVFDGRLCIATARGEHEPVSELSHGERWRLALDLAAKGLPKGAVLPVCQEAFESLDPDNRAFIHQLAVERGITLVTAEATDGELRAEVFGGEHGTAQD